MNDTPNPDPKPTKLDVSQWVNVGAALVVVFACYRVWNESEASTGRLAEKFERQEEKIDERFDKQQAQGRDTHDKLIELGVNVAELRKDNEALSLLAREMDARAREMDARLRAIESNR